MLAWAGPALLRPWPALACSWVLHNGKHLARDVLGRFVKVTLDRHAKIAKWQAMCSVHQERTLTRKQSLQWLQEMSGAHARHSMGKLALTLPS
jgi:hypothetical protein